MAAKQPLLDHPILQPASEPSLIPYRTFIITVRLIILTAICMTLIQPAPVRAAGVCFVKWDADGTNTGVNWANAYNDLQAAINNADCLEIWVAAGVYKPTGSMDRTISFELRGNMALYGGFAGSETERDVRDWTANPTILSGDIGTTLDPSDNSYHVVYASFLEYPVTLDGFTITAGNADSIAMDGYGGGILSINNPLVLKNLTFVDNSAINGGGLSLIEGASTVSNILFLNNSAELGGGMAVEDSDLVLDSIHFDGNSSDYGGGLFTRGSAAITNVSFTANSAARMGGGMFSSSGTIILQEAVFSNNASEEYGGGLAVYGDLVAQQVLFSENSAGTDGGAISNFSNLELVNVTLIGNIAAGDGGGIMNFVRLIVENATISQNHAGGYGGALATDLGIDVKLTHATLSDNTALQGGGGVYSRSGSKPTILQNSILWGNVSVDGGDQIHQLLLSAGGTGTMQVTHSIFQDGCPAEINCIQVLSADPLLGVLGDYGGLTQTIPISVGSSARDAASDAFCPAVDQRGVARPQGRGCDMGAFELVYYETFLPVVVH